MTRELSNEISKQYGEKVTEKIHRAMAISLDMTEFAQWLEVKDDFNKAKEWLKENKLQIQLEEDITNVPNFETEEDEHDYSVKSTMRIPLPAVKISRILFDENALKKGRDLDG